MSSPNAQLRVCARSQDTAGDDRRRSPRSYNLVLPSGCDYGNVVHDGINQLGSDTVLAAPRTRAEMASHRADQRFRTARLSDSMLLSSWREYACQMLESDARAPHAVADVFRGAAGPETTSPGQTPPATADSPGLENAKRYLVHLAQKDPTLEPEASEAVLERFKRRFVVEDKGHATLFQAADDVTKQSVILKERHAATCIVSNHRMLLHMKATNARLSLQQKISRKQLCRCMRRNS